MLLHPAVIIFLTYISKSEQGFGIIRWPGSANDLSLIIKRYDDAKHEAYTDDDDTRYSKKAYGDLRVSPILELGKLCVYHSECTGCGSGYSQQCIANRCQCVSIATQCDDELTPHPKSYIDCILYHKANAALVYYDKGFQKCIIDKYKSETTTTCGSHHIITSAVDGERYCLNAIDPIDMICYDNQMCQDALKTNETVGLCYSGLCHAMSTSNLTDYVIKTPSCHSDYHSYCREMNYSFNRVTHGRNAQCSIECKERFGVGGIAAAYSKNCQCFKVKRVQAHRIRDPM